MNIAYARVSTLEQHEDRQLEGLKKYNIDKWFIEKGSGINYNRQELQKMLEFAREGDTIYIWDFSRLSRSLKDLLSIIERLENKGITLISIKENLDSSTPTGKLMISMVGAINEFERANLLERQREGIAIAKAKGKYKGRKAIEYPDNWEEVYNKWKVREITAIKAMELTGLKKNTFYKLVKEYEVK
ncbi:MAG: recombinase family protein [Clostridium sp.]|uniref:recombinase family protein n=1 Tax=Clostridium sp. TaxID=1506 RepID=UPI0028FE01E1|nr:recombinase family protein [Clostridium sp.]MDU1584844.1 recombinase family protein [Clostridium sp.]